MLGGGTYTVRTFRRCCVFASSRICRYAAGSSALSFSSLSRAASFASSRICRYANGWSALNAARYITSLGEKDNENEVRGTDGFVIYIQLYEVLEF